MGIPNEKCKGLNLQYFQISKLWKKYCGGQNIENVLLSWAMYIQWVQNLEYFQISNYLTKYKSRELGISNQKCGGQNLEYFQI